MRGAFSLGKKAIGKIELTRIEPPVFYVNLKRVEKNDVDTVTRGGGSNMIEKIVTYFMDSS